MLAVNVVLLQSDPGTTQSLIVPLCNFFRSVREARSFAELRSAVAEQHLEVVILDMEMASLNDVTDLSHEFSGIRIICNHRVADEALWTATLNAGAVDCCPSRDARGIVAAAVRHAPPARLLAA